MFSRLIVAYVLTFMSLRLLAAEPHFAITGRVTDSEGAAIAKARLLIHSDSSGDQVSRRPTRDGRQDVEVLTKTAEDVSVLTDANGSYSVSIPPGFYDVFVSAPMLTPIAAKVIVKQGQQATFSVKLGVDPLVSKELGGMDVYAGPDEP